MDKLQDYEDFKHFRFQCRCLDAQDAMDITVEDGLIIITMDFKKLSWKDRLDILRGRWTWKEFLPREEDYQAISDIFKQ